MIPSEVQILLLCIVCVSVIVAYGTFRCKRTSFSDPLTKSFFPSPFNNYLDGWGLSHFFFYLALTFFYPKHIVLIFIAGLTWEVIESLLKDRPFYISKCQVDPVIDTDGKEKSPWWYGRWEDIVMNTLGMMLGYWLSQVV